MDSVENYIGKKYNDVKNNLKLFSDIIRVFDKTNCIGTADYIPDRLNICLDDNGIIQDIYWD